ncbi:MAG: hypothetical protein ABIE43_02750 [Patescibacteria group bacterium]
MIHKIKAYKGVKMLKGNSRLITICLLFYVFCQKVYWTLKINPYLIFFGCSMRGGRDFVSEEELAKIPEIIEELGCQVPSKHQSSKSGVEDDGKLENRFIHDRDYRWLIKCRAGIFEISNPSLGTGGEISDMIALDRPVLLLYKKGLEVDVSKYIQGKKGSEFVHVLVECHAYDTPNDIEKIIREFLKNIRV